jgi:hypothetical protein
MRNDYKARTYQNAECPKCGWKYDQWMPIVQYHEKAPSATGCWGIFKEHLHASCPRCGYDGPEFMYEVLS